MTHLSVSVVIPVYNRPKMVSVAVSSVLRQTYPVKEIIVVDDGSNPPLELLPVSTASCVKCIRLDHNTGPSKARQIGILAAEDDLIAFLDSDDFWLSDKLQHQIPPFVDGLRNGTLAVTCGFIEVRGVRRRLRIPIPARSPDEFASGCWYNPGSTLVVARSAFENIQFDEKLRRLEDFDWLLRFSLKGGTIAVSPYAGVVIHKRPHRSRQAVNNAADRILGKFRSLEDPNISRKLRAWLCLEQAVAAWRDGRIGDAVRYATISLVLAPRLRLHLKQWWRE